MNESDSMVQPIGSEPGATAENVNAVTDARKEPASPEKGELLRTKSPVPAPVVPTTIPNDGQDTAAPMTPKLLVPSLRGKLIVDGNMHVCRGVWAMSDEAHSIPGSTSDFEFKLVRPDDANQVFPKNGKYQGWFILKHTPPMRGSSKIDDKDMTLTFVAKDEGGFAVEGRGTNKFGTFALKGSMAIDGMIQMYRSYVPKAQVPKKRTVSPSDGSKKKTAPKVSATVVAREAEPRMRRKSSFGAGFEVDESFAETAPAPLPRGVSAPPALVKSESISATGETARSAKQKISKCESLLKECCKFKFGFYFLEPVDPVRLNIPEYPNIIKHPMDYRTIRELMERGDIASPETFADHMRLVYQNATRFNESPENPVHVAAKECSKHFEERYRKMQAAGVSRANSFTAAELAPLPPAPKKVAAPKAAKQPTLSRRPSAQFVAPVATRPQPTFVPPPMDVNAHQLADMMKRMEEMQNEIVKLRTAVKQGEVTQQIEIQREAAHNPLTFQEKQKLIEQIQNLPNDKMNEVIDIIRAVHNTGGSEEVEVPLDELDTLTLRKLQKVVEEHEKKQQKRPASSSSGGASKKRKSSSGKPGAVGSSAQPSAASAASTAAAAATTTTTSSALDAPNMLVEEEHADLLFSVESFDELHPTDMAGGIGSAEGNDAASSVPTGQGLSNADAWSTPAPPLQPLLPAASSGGPSASGSGSGSGPSAASGSMSGSAAASASSEWNEAAAEIEQRKALEREREAEEARLQALRAKQERDRAAAMAEKLRSDQGKDAAGTGTGQATEASAREDKEAAQKALDRQREEERLQLQNMHRTVDLDDKETRDEMSMFDL